MKTNPVNPQYMPRIFITNQVKLAAMFDIDPRCFSDITNGWITPCDTLAELLQHVTGISKTEWKLEGRSKLKNFFKKEKEEEMNFIKGKGYSNFFPTCYGRFVAYHKTKIHETNARVKFIE